MVTQRRNRSVRDVKRRARVGISATVVATVLSSCAGTAPQDGSLIATQVAAGPPLALLRTAVDRRAAGAPLQLVQADRTNWIDDAVESSAAEPGATDGARQPAEHKIELALSLDPTPADTASADVGEEQPGAGPAAGILASAGDGAIAAQAAGLPLQFMHADRPERLMGLDLSPVVTAQAAAEAGPPPSGDDPAWPVATTGDTMLAEHAVGEPLRLIDPDRPDWLQGWDHAAVVAGAPADLSVPLILADGSQYWPEPVDLADEPCPAAGDRAMAVAGCAAADDQIALADIVVDDAALSEMRGGFVTAGGFQIDFGYYIETLVDGVTQLTSALTLDDMLAGNTSDIPVVGSISLSGTNGTSTMIEHNLSAAEISATIENTQSNIDVSTIATLAIEVVDLRHVQTGQMSNTMPRMPMELQQSIIRGMR